MSESLKGILPEFETGIENNDLIKGFVSVVMSYKTQNDDQKHIVGSLAGVELSDVMKLDIRIQTFDAFEFVKEWHSGKHKIIASSICLNLGDGEILFESDHEVKVVKIYGIEPKNEMCVLAIDLTSI